MDNNKTNKLLQEGGLDDTLNETVNQTAELPSWPTPVTRQEVIVQLQQLIDKQDFGLKERIDYLKQVFYKLPQAKNLENSEKSADISETEVIANVSQTSETATNNQAMSEVGKEKPADLAEPTPDKEEVQLKTLLNSWREKRAAYNASLEKQRLDNLEQKKQIIEAIHNLTESTDDISKTLPEFRRLQQAWKEAGNIPQEQVNELWKMYQLQVERFYDLIKINNEFRDYDFKKNLEIKIALCETAEKLAEEPDVVLAFRHLQKLHEEWRETGPVDRENREEIWNRFKNASSIINKNHQHFFERIKLSETENLTKKTAICEQVEAIDFTSLHTYKDWDTKTTEILQLQEQWKAIGFAPKKFNNRIFERFRTACDRFFQLKGDFYKSSKEILNQNLDKKKHLCEKAESLKDSTDWKTTSDILVRIQKEWKTIGPVPKKQSDVIWKRFIEACDYFFEQKEKNAPNQKSEEIQNLEAKQALIEQINETPEGTPEEEAHKIYHEAISKWNTIGHVPFKEKDVIYTAWHESLDHFTERLNISKTNRRLNRFQQNLDDMNTKGQGKVLHERERLLRQFDNLGNEIKTAENNIGFFTQSKSSNNDLLKNLTLKIEQLKEERELLYKKIKLIDEQL